MATRCNIVIKRGDDEILFYRHWDGMPSVTGVELLGICRDSNFDVFGIIQSMAREDQYELTQGRHGDAEYEYTIDLDNAELTALHIPYGRRIRSEEFEESPEAEEEFGPEGFSDMEGMSDRHQEWHPRFPVNMDEPVALTEEQKERALKIFEAITAHIEAYPDEPTAPLICITQDWRVRVDFGGWNCASDYRDDALCVMCRDEEGVYINLEYVEQCVPFIEKKLKELADDCMEIYGEVPDHHEQDNNRVFTAEMELLSILSDPTIKEFGFGNVLIAMDTMEGSIYPIPSYMEHDDYGGIIQYVPAATLVGKDGSIEVDKVKALVNDFLKPI